MDAVIHDVLYSTVLCTTLYHDKLIILSITVSYITKNRLNGYHNLKLIIWAEHSSFTKLLKNRRRGKCSQVSSSLKRDEQLATTVVFAGQFRYRAKDILMGCRRRTFHATHDTFKWSSGSVGNPENTVNPAVRAPPGVQNTQPDYSATSVVKTSTLLLSGSLCVDVLANNLKRLY